MRSDVPRLRLGAGAGFAGDRIDPAVELASQANLDYLVFECLGERTVAAGHARRLADPTTGYDPLLAPRLRAVLPHAARQGTGIVTNSGAAHPAAAGETARRIVAELGLQSRVAVVTGDDVLDVVRRIDPELWETGQPLSSASAELISANAYLGCEPIVAALEDGADLVVTGRVADPALYLGPLVHAFGWSLDDWDRLGAGTVVGHLLECAGQLTGGYFADPLTKPVAGLARLGFPFADVDPDGRAVLGKVDGSGGRLDRRTCGEQLLYEVGDPSSYVTPDVIADFTGVSFEETGRDRVAVSGAAGAARPDQLKVTLGFRDGWLGEGQISYAGPRALERAQLAAEVVRERLVAIHGLAEDAITVEMIGAGAAFRGWADAAATDPLEVRLRVSARVHDEDAAHAVGWEVESLYTNGPAGGGGARGLRHERVAIRSCLVPRDLVTPRVEVI
ncbi:acyclic terpene utilization AtuA family protein [Nocardioides sambongensis]|uniref:acyclic terpene utilization AtuA family protein n=1 Tax=Nocardioides sambongensis TaxID=2589074 RepID=UPI0018C8B757|nr:acyclic terpene utilization AtuA family protein [Nocardioides sambongensis]